METLQGRTEPPGNLALARWANWSVGQVAATSNAEGGSGTEEGAMALS